MGTITIEGTRTKAPSISCTVFGVPTWSGKSVSDLTSDDMNALTSFIKSEASRQGHNDAIYGTRQGEKSLFHPEFLDGKAYQLWEMHYRRVRGE